VRERQEQEQAEVAKLIERGTPVAKLKTGIDGGMNQVFAARVPGGNTGLSEGGEGQGLALAGFTPAPGTVPSTVNPPRDPSADEAAATPATTWTAPAPPAPSRVAAASTPSSSSASSSSSTQSGGFFADLVRKVGLGAASDTTAGTAAAAPAKPKMADAKRSEPPKPEAWTPKTAATKPVEVKQESKQAAAARPVLKPALSDATADPATPLAKDTLVAGAQPIVSSSSFESRFSAAK
jgi:hypothetical protein